MKYEKKTDEKLFWKEVELTDSLYFDLEEEGEFDLNEVIREYFKTGDILKITVVKTEKE